MKKKLIALILCLVSIIISSCGNSTSNGNVNVTAQQADVWQNIGNITVYTGAYVTDAESAKLFVKNVYGTNYYQIKINGYTYGVEENPVFGDFEQRIGKGRDEHKYKHKAGSYYLNLPGEDVASELARLELNAWRRIKSVHCYCIIRQHSDSYFIGKYGVGDLDLYQNGKGEYKLKDKYSGEEWPACRNPHYLDEETGSSTQSKYFEYKAGKWSFNM